MKHALNLIASLAALPSVLDAMLRFTFQLISSASIVCPTANHAILATLAIFVPMGTCTIPTLHNASVHLPKAAPSSSVDLSSSAVQSIVLSVTTSPNAPSALQAFQWSEVSASIAKACAKPVKAPTSQRVLPARLVLSSIKQLASDAVTPTAKSAQSSQLFAKNVGKDFTWKTIPASLAQVKTACSATAKENAVSAVLGLV